MTTKLRGQSILGTGVILLLACSDLADFPEAERFADPGVQPAETAAVVRTTPSRDAELAGLQAGNVSYTVGALMISGMR